MNVGCRSWYGDGVGMWTRLLKGLRLEPLGTIPVNRIHDFTYQHVGHTLDRVKDLDDGSVFISATSVRVNAGDVVVMQRRDWTTTRYRLLKVKHFVDGTWRAYARPEQLRVDRPLTPFNTRGQVRLHRSAPANTLRLGPRASGSRP